MTDSELRAKIEESQERIRERENARLLEEANRKLGMMDFPPVLKQLAAEGQTNLVDVKDDHKQPVEAMSHLPGNEWFGAHEGMPIK